MISRRLNGASWDCLPNCNMSWSIAGQAVYVASLDTFGHSQSVIAAICTNALRQGHVMEDRISFIDRWILLVAYRDDMLLSTLIVEQLILVQAPARHSQHGAEEAGRQEDC